MKPSPIPGCLWVTDHLLVRTKRAAKTALPQALLKGLFAAGVGCSLNLLSKQEFLDAGSDALFGPFADAMGEHSTHQRGQQPKVVMTYLFWEADGLPTARQVRQALESIEDAHAVGLHLLVNGMGDPARAAIVAGCWLARQGYRGTQGRLGWLKAAHDTLGERTPPIFLSTAERKFVSDWPTGTDGQPELADMEWSDRDEVFPFATVEHWLGKLSAVRVYTARGKGRPVDVPVVNGQRISDGAEIDLDLNELRRGTWTGERTLRLPNGWQIVFIPS